MTTTRQRPSALRVLHIIVPQREGAIGGADLHVLDLATAQRQTSDTRPSILAPRASRDYLRRISEAGVEVLSPGLFRLDRYRGLPRARDIQLIHAHGYEANYLVAAMRAICHHWRRTPLVITAHGWIETTVALRFKSRLDRRCGALADVRIATAARHAPRLQTGTGVVMVIPNGVPDPGPRPTSLGTRESIRRSLGVPPHATIIGSVGRLSLEKRVDLVLATAHRLVPDHPDIHVLVIGGGDQRAELTALAHRLGISRKVTFTGLLHDVTPALITMDILVQASDTEGTPRSVLEAMAHHLPVVATDVGDVAELLDHGHCGEGDRFSVQGWWNISPNACATVYGGSVGYNRYWAFYAEAADGRTWTGDIRSWVSNNAFKLCHSDSCSPCRVVGFRQFDVNSYDNYTINLVA